MVRKITVTLDKMTLAEIDRWVQRGKYPSRSRIVQTAVDRLVERENRLRLAREIEKLDPKEEQQLAEGGPGDLSWPTY